MTTGARETHRIPGATSPDVSQQDGVRVTEQRDARLLPTPGPRPPRRRCWLVSRKIPHGSRPSKTRPVRPGRPSARRLPSKQETYAYPQSGQGAQGAQDAQNAQSPQSAQSPQGYGQGYAQQGGYTPPAYTVQDQAYGAQDRPYADQAYGDQAYQEQQQGQSAPHWQAVSGLKPAGAAAKRT